MYYGTRMPPFGDVWRELQKDWDGDDVPRVEDDDIERRFWKGYIRSRGPDGTDQYSETIWKEVESILGERYYDSITEIGPGWGNYTFDLAEHCREMTCVDISPDVLRFIAAKGKESGLRIRTANSKWEDYRGGGTDVVFGFNCFYRMKDIEDCLRKIDETGKELHIIGMTSGPEQRYYRDFEEELGLRIRYHRLDYIVLVNILYQLGIDCNVRIVDLERDYAYASVAKAARKASRRILSDGYDEDDLVRIMRRHLKKGDDGMYHYVHRFKAAIVYWRSGPSSRPSII